MVIVGWFGHCKCLLHECTFSSGTINKQLCTQSTRGKKENWEGSQFPICKQEINLLSQSSDPLEECIRFTKFCKKNFQAFLWPRCCTHYSDTSANEDNSFRNHIRYPKSSLAKTWFPVGFYRKSFNRSGCCPLFNGKFYKIVKSTL